MDKIYKYSVLKYRPSFYLDERLNVGLLFVFPNEEQAVFIYPKSLKRLKDFYPDVSLARFKKYLSVFKQKAKRLETDFQSDTLLGDHFLVPDGNSFFFSDFKIGVYTSKEVIVDYYKNEYFRLYQQESKTNPNTQLTKQFKKQLDQFPEKLHFFHKKVAIPNKIDTTEFDYAWQNGTTNLVKSLSFQLANKESIQRKSFRWYGEFSQLKKAAQSHQWKVDILVDKPKHKELFKPYEEALTVLSSLETPHQIVESSGLNGYVENAVETVKELPQKQLNIIQS